MRSTVGWGIVGPGDIARKFATALSVLPDAKLVAVGSRSQERADQFGEEFHVPHRYGSYDELFLDPAVDVVYIATLHPQHKDHTQRALQAGKAVLCEKPFTINAAEAQAVIELARRKQLFVMEAMWTHFLPVIAQVRAWVAQGAIGEARMIAASFGFRTGWDPIGDRALNPVLGGGALLDVGCYTLAFAQKIFGSAPQKCLSLAYLGETGVDEQSVAVLDYGGGRLASLSSAVRTRIPDEARILGTEGDIYIPHFWRATKATLARPRQPEEIVEIAHEGNGYNYQAAEVMRCLRQGRTESEIWPLQETLSVMKTMDDLRKQWGLIYPSETPA
jgi:predicted dehydrogenase